MAGGFHTAKKHEIVQAVREGGLDTPYTRKICSSAFQICEIRVNKLLGGEKKSAEIYGSIHLHHSEGDWKLYNRDKNNTETINVPGPIAVTHPKFGILACDPVTIAFEFDMDSELNEMDERFISWRPHKPRDKVLIYKLKGKESIMEVSFIVFSRAVFADMEICLDNIDDGEGIYGTIKASFKEKIDDLEPFYLFNRKSENDYVCVNARKAIPLLRPFIVLPHGNGLVITVDLKTVSSTPVASGEIEICPDRFGNWVGVLGKKDGEIEVKASVAFSHYQEHHPTFEAYEAFKASLRMQASNNSQFVPIGGGHELGESGLSSVLASA